MNRSIFLAATVAAVLLNLMPMWAQKKEEPHFTLSSTPQLPANPAIQIAHWGGGEGTEEITVRAYHIEDPIAFFRKHRHPNSPDYVGIIDSKALPSSTRQGGRTDGPTEFSLVATWEHQIARGKWAAESIPLPLDKPGAYLVEASTRQRKSLVVAIVSPIALTLDIHGDEVIVYVAEKLSGRKITGFPLALTLAGEEFSSGQTDSNGVFRALIPEAGGSKGEGAYNDGQATRPIYAFGERGGEIAIGYVDYNTSGLDKLPYRVYLHSDRPSYSIGDTVYFRGIVRRVDDRGEYVPAEGDRVTLQLTQPESYSKKQETFTLAADGEFSGMIPSIGPETGFYSGLVSISSSVSDNGVALGAFIPLGTQTFRFAVGRSTRAPFHVDVTTDRSAYSPGGTIVATVRVTDHSGAPIADADGYYNIESWSSTNEWWPDSIWNYRHRRDYRSDVQGYRYDGPGRALRSSSDGTMQFRYTTRPDQTSPLTLDVHLHKKGSNEWVRRTVTVPLSGEKLKLTARAERILYRTDQPIRIEVHAADPASNTPVSTPFKIHLRRPASSGPATGESLWSGEGMTRDDGMGNVTAILSQGGYLTVDVEATGGKRSVPAEGMRIVVADPAADEWKERGPGPLQIITGRDVYRSGDTVEALIVLPTATVDPLLLIWSFSPLSPRIIPTVVPVERLGGRLAMLHIPVERRHGLGFSLEGYAIASDGDYSAATRIDILPKGSLIDLSLQPESDSYRPGESASVLLHVADEDGNPMRDAIISLSVVDEAAYALGLRYDRSEMARRLFVRGGSRKIDARSSLDFIVWGAAFKNEKGKWVPDEERSDEINVRETEKLPNFGGGTARATYNLDGLDSPIPSSTETMKPIDRLLWMPSIRTDAEGNARVTFTLPDQPAVWRVTAHAATASGGAGENVIRIRVE